MMKSGVVERTLGSRGGRYVWVAVIFPLAVVTMALLVGGMVGALDSSISVLLVGAIIMTVVAVIRQDELAVMLVVAEHLYIDWYLGLHVVALVVALTVLAIFFFMRSPTRPWVRPGALWLWALFLVLAIYPAIQGALTLYDTASYYPSNILGAFLMYWLGIIIARDMPSARRFLKLLTLFGVLLAADTILQAATGTLVFGSNSDRISSMLDSVSNYQLFGSEVHRAGSFLLNPDWNGAFFAMMVFPPLGLLFESPSLLEKVMYLGAVALVLFALLSTYSTGAWLSVAVTTVVFMVFVGHNRYRLLFPFIAILLAAIIAIVFPAQIALQIQHATNPIEIPLRLGAWQTAIQVIQAFPLTGVGLGYQAYILRAEPYRVPTQFVPLAHPHNSFLELGAMGGLPLLCVFMALLFFALRQSWQYWLLLDARGRSLLAGGIGAVIALSMNSLSVNVWTLPPLAAMGWLILGVISSPLLTARRTVGGQGAVVRAVVRGTSGPRPQREPKDQGSALTCQLTKEEEA